MNDIGNSNRPSRIKVVAFLGAVAAGLGLLVMNVVAPNQPSDRDLMIAKQVVQARTSETVIRVDPKPDGTVEVTTGWVKDPLSGDGHLFRLRKILGKWIVVSQSRWAA